jgi:hypothetical protein
MLCSNSDIFWRGGGGCNTFNRGICNALKALLAPLGLGIKDISVSMWRENQATKQAVLKYLLVPSGTCFKG